MNIKLQFTSGGAGPTIKKDCGGLKKVVRLSKYM